MNDPEMIRDEARRMLPNAEAEAFLKRMEADRARFERQFERRRRIALWSLIPYGLAGASAWIGISFVFAAGMRGTFALLVVGFIVLTACQWIMPEVARRSDRKE